MGMRRKIKDDQATPAIPIAPVGPKDMWVGDVAPGGEREEGADDGMQEFATCALTKTTIITEERGI